MCCPSRWYGRMQNMTLYKYHSLLKNKPLLKYPSLPTATLPWTRHLLSDWTVFPQSQIPLYGRRANSSSLQKMCFVKITPSQMSGPSCRDAPEPRLSGGRDTETFCHEGCRDRSSEQPEEYSSTQQFLIRNQAGDVRQQLLRRAWKQRDSEVWKKRRECGKQFSVFRWRDKTVCQLHHSQYGPMFKALLSCINRSYITYLKREKATQCKTK